MGALMIVAIVLGSVVSYVLIGWGLAKRDLPNAWIRARKTWHGESMTRDSVKEQTVAMVLTWPVLWLVRYLSRTLNEAITTSDPKEMQRKAELRERQQQQTIDAGKRTIAKLERELGLEPSDDIPKRR